MTDPTPDDIRRTCMLQYERIRQWDFHRQGPMRLPMLKFRRVDEGMPIGAQPLTIIEISMSTQHGAHWLLARCGSVVVTLAKIAAR